ncbi:MAG: hypothetical protein EXS35_17955 [Pedosphaera sp.]|nr:hypothetical protein [Pedosphaera sp.]
MVVPSFYGYARVFDVETRQPVATLRGFMLGVHTAAFSPDGGRLVLSSGVSVAMTVWDTSSFERLLNLPAYGSSFSGTAFSPDGNVLAELTGTGGEGGTLYYWRAPSWAELEQAEAAERAGVAKP